MDGDGSRPALTRGTLVPATDGVLVPAADGVLVPAADGVLVRTTPPDPVTRLQRSILYFIGAVAAGALLNDAVGFAGWAVAWGGAGVPHGVGWWRSRRRARRLQQLPRSEDLAGLGAGSLVRVRGQIVEGPTFDGALSKRRVVVAWYGGTVGETVQVVPWFRSLVEVHAIEFQIALASGALVRVCVDPLPVSLDDIEFKPRDLAGPRLRRDVALSPMKTQRVCLYDEVSVGPGNIVEIIGALDFLPDAAGERLHARAMPLSPVLRGVPGAPLLITRARP